MLVMVFEVIRIPIKFFLPSEKNLLHLPGLITLVPNRKFAFIDSHMVKLETHIEFVVGEATGILEIDVISLADGHAIVMGKHILIHLLENHVVPIFHQVMLGADKVRRLLAIGEGLLPNRIDDVAAESIDPFVEPEA